MAHSSHLTRPHLAVSLAPASRSLARTLALFLRRHPSCAFACMCGLSDSWECFMSVRLLRTPPCLRRWQRRRQRQQQRKVGQLVLLFPWPLDNSCERTRATERERASELMLGWIVCVWVMACMCVAVCVRICIVLI